MAKEKKPERKRVVIPTEQSAGDRTWKRRNRAMPLGESERDHWEYDEKPKKR
jgi:hypothetical protein